MNRRERHRAAMRLYGHLPRSLERSWLLREDRQGVRKWMETYRPRLLETMELFRPKLIWVPTLPETKDPVLSIPWPCWVSG